MQKSRLNLREKKIILYHYHFILLLLMLIELQFLAVDRNGLPSMDVDFKDDVLFLQVFLRVHPLKSGEVKA